MVFAIEEVLSWECSLLSAPDAEAFLSLLGCASPNGKKKEGILKFYTLPLFAALAFCCIFFVLGCSTLSFLSLP